MDHRDGWDEQIRKFWEKDVKRGDQCTDSIMFEDEWKLCTDVLESLSIDSGSLLETSQVVLNLKEKILTLVTLISKLSPSTSFLLILDISIIVPIVMLMFGVNISKSVLSTCQRLETNIA